LSRIQWQLLLLVALYLGFDKQEMISRQPRHQNIMHNLFSLTASSFPIGRHPYPLFSPITASRPTRYLPSALYRNFQTRHTNSLIPKIAILVFVETLQNRQYPTRRIPESQVMQKSLSQSVSLGLYQFADHIWH
jgi:hypothetical protein